MKFSYKENKLFYSNAEIFSAEYPIQEIIEIDDICFVLFDYYLVNSNTNVFIIDKEGFVKWKIPEPETMYKNSSFDGLYLMEDQKVKIFNWEGSHMIVDKEGNVLKSLAESRKGKKPW